MLVVASQSLLSYVGHSLGADGTLRVSFPNVCSRILLDYIDPKLLLLGELNQRRSGLRKVKGVTGRILHFLAEKPLLGFLGRRLKRNENVKIEMVIRGSNHQTIVKKFNEKRAHFLDVEIADCSRPCSGPLSGDWTVTATAASSINMCTQVDCDRDRGVCRCETTNPERPIIQSGTLIALGPLGVCHEGNTLTGEWRPNPQQTVTLRGTVEPGGRPGILDDHVSFAHEFKTDIDCGGLHMFVVGDGTVTVDLGNLGLPGLLGAHIEGNWQRTDRTFLTCRDCPPPGNLLLDCVASGSSFEIEIFSFGPSMEQSGSTDLDIGPWRKRLT